MTLIGPVALGRTSVQPPVSFIFDLDGTLVDSLQDITDALNAALRDLNRAPASADQVRSWVGDGLTMLCRRALGGTSDPDLPRLVERASEQYQAHCVVHTRPYPNILKMLELLIAQGSPLAVLSNKPHAMTVEVIRVLKMDRYFVEVRGATSDEDRKPSPLAALELARRLERKPGDVFLVGDSLVDIETARRAGMKSVAVTWGFQGREFLAAERPDFLIDDPMKIFFLAG